MTNKQLAAARKAMNQYPHIVFRMVPEGVRVGDIVVEVPTTMSAQAVYQACVAAVDTQA